MASISTALLPLGILMATLIPTGKLHVPPPSADGPNSDIAMVGPRLICLIDHDPLHDHAADLGNPYSPGKVAA
jgi:hypothetical protein